MSQVRILLGAPCGLGTYETAEPTILDELPTTAGPEADCRELRASLPYDFDSICKLDRTAICETCC